MNYDRCRLYNMPLSKEVPSNCFRTGHVAVAAVQHIAIANTLVVGPERSKAMRKQPIHNMKQFNESFYRAAWNADAV